MRKRKYDIEKEAQKMFDKNKLKYYALCKNKSTVEIAEALSIDKSTLWRKMSGSSDFSREEVQKIKEFLGLSNDQAMEIFFGQ